MGHRRGAARLSGAKGGALHNDRVDRRQENRTQHGGYSGTKAAVAAIMDGLRQEVAGLLRVTTIYPGYTDTNFANHVRDAQLRAQLQKAGDSYAMSPKSVAAAIAYAIEQPEDVTIGEIVIRSRNQP